MAKFTIYARRITDYTYEVEADDAEAAYDSMNDMIDVDFEAYITGNTWNFEIEEE